MLLLKLLEKQGQVKPKTSRRREIIKIRVKLNETESKTTIQFHEIEREGKLPNTFQYYTYPKPRQRHLQKGEL
jgi:hypothetical protein